MKASRILLKDGEGFRARNRFDGAARGNRNVLEKTNLSGYFSTIVSAEDIEECKPHPECYLRGFNAIDEYRMSLSHLPMVHSECLVIEDSPPGIQSAKSARLKALGVTNTVSAQELREAGADAIAKNLDDWMPDQCGWFLTNRHEGAVS